MKRTPLTRKTPLRSRPSQRARPDEPLAVWCEAHISLKCTGRATDRHHVKRRSQGGSDDKSNTVDCCRPCHEHIHRNPVEAVERGFLSLRTVGVSRSYL